MSATYHRLPATDELDAIAWWATAFGDDPAIITSAFCSDPERFERSFVARTADDTIIAAITYWVRLLRDAVGQPRRVAHLWGVGMPHESTDPERQQCADQLVAWALQAAQDERCEFALCYPAPETIAHYTASGWHMFPHHYRQGTFSGVQLATTSAYTVRPFDLSDGWEPLAAIYGAYNAMRPASVVRDLSYWHNYLQWRWGEWAASDTSTILVATPVDDPATPRGYIIPKYYDDTFIIAEIGVDPSAAATLPMLITGVLEEATRRGVVDRFRVYMPSEPQIDSLVNQLFSPAVLEGYSGMHAVYPLRGVTLADLQTMFTAPGSYSWLLDQF